ncbi:MAG: PIG-L family deacetylase [Methanomassiliicoccales archaeon]|nr:PIG-L family deacetylase [Methanomassiliicoccales archaeon]
MSYQSFLELRFIAERIRNRIVTSLTLSKASWTPKLIETIPGKRFLVLAPHPDDDAIGCGGTISKLVESQKEVRICYLSIQSVEGIRESERMNEIENSLKEMGVSDYKFLAKKFPSLDDVSRIIIKEISNYEPHAVFVPSPVENNDVHLKTFYSYLRSAKTARNLRFDWLTVLYEIWNPLIPNVVIDITRYMPQKIQAIEAHKSQLAHLDFTRLAKGLNCYRSATVSMNGYAEAFILLPRGDFVRLFMKRG